ncbi:extracellular solute-binding protein [Wenjunlia tyrosinilytica]|uniref:Sugar transporter n=1 Tax=Wenjunlia tyrosinilytica TaxID=1544741 RepID=A0A918DWG4_9ACTN|nr:extracellular solute-binding protein [Wenjunlia tyrosinilytica]GGO85620.1 sugar transporter [Wenjunlia tyrosinilytica]
MQRKRNAAFTVIAAASMVFGLAACGSDGGDGDGKKADAGNSKGKTLTVWFMSGSNPKQWTADIKAAFEKQTGAKLDVKVQQWNGIQQKLTTALSESSPPDVFEIGNTQTPAYAATGGLADLADVKGDLGADQWTKSLNQSAVVDGKQYAAPWYFANRVVVYNKEIWKKAGIKATPKSRSEFLADLQKIKKTGNEPIYLPGQNWYVLDGLLIENGADLVKKDGDKYVSNLSDPKVGKAMEEYKKLQAYSNAPKDKDEATPQQAEVFAKGKTGTMIAMGWEAATAIAANKSIESKIGYFTVPGATSAKPGGVFLGGSNLAVSQNSKNPALAREFLKLAMSDKFEGALAKEAGVIPNKESLNSNLDGNAVAQAATPSVPFGGTTPLIPEWAAVENPPNPIKSYMTAYLSGKSHEAAAKSVEAEINKRLSQKQ